MDIYTFLTISLVLLLGAFLDFLRLKKIKVSVKQKEEHKFEVQIKSSSHFDVAAVLLIAVIYSEILLWILQQIGLKVFLL